VKSRRLSPPRARIRARGGRKPGFDHVGPGNKVTATLGQSVQPGDVARLQVAFEGTPRADNLVILCNGAGQYAAGRRAMLAFDR
jgi:hypothetical protein